MSEKRSGAPRAKARGSFYFPAKPMLRRYTALIRLAAYFGNLPGAYLPIHPRVKTRGFLGEGIKYCVPGFSVRDNVLSYVFEGGGRIDFRGEWSLDDENNLVFSLKDDGEDPGRIVLRGRIISARAGVLAFEAAGVNESGTLEWQVFELYGQWYADGDGKLAFRLRKSGGSRGRLVFQSSWEINEDQQIVYKYTRERLKRTGERETVCVSFSGRWSVFSSSRLVYSLSGSSREGFAFKAHLQTPNLYPAAGRIKAGLYGRRIDRDLWSHAVDQRQIRLRQEVHWWGEGIVRTAFEREVRLTLGQHQRRQDGLQHERRAAGRADAEPVIARLDRPGSKL